MQQGHCSYGSTHNNTWLVDWDTLICQGLFATELLKSLQKILEDTIGSYHCHILLAHIIVIFYKQNSLSNTKDITEEYYNTLSFISFISTLVQIRVVL